MPTKRPAPTPIAIPPGSLRVWWVHQVTRERELVPVRDVTDAKQVLWIWVSLEPDRYEQEGCGGLEVFRDGEWREWHNADGNDIRWVMADAEAA